MKAIILHGIGGHAGVHWQGWLHDQLQSEGFEVLMPDLPEPDHPDRKVWLDTIKELLNDVELGDLLIIAHSLGVTSALDFIEQTTGSVQGLVSVSGFSDDYGAELNSYFLKKKSVDFLKIRPKLKWSAVFYGDNDPYVTQEALQNLTKSLEVIPVIIAGGGHLNTEAGFTEFPQLLTIIKRKSQL